MHKDIIGNYYDVVKEHTEIQQQYIDGSKVQRKRFGTDDWVDDPCPLFQWEVFDYRVKHEPIVGYVVTDRFGNLIGFYQTKIETGACLREHPKGRVFKLIEETKKEVT